MKTYTEIGRGIIIDKTSKIPYYYQLKQYIIQEIKSGNWKPGQQIIPEIKICQIFDISRSVVRQTYQELVNEGYLVKIKAKGTFIVEPKIPENIVQSLMGFYEDMTARGYEVKNDILLQKKIIPDSIVSEKLNLEKNEEVIVIRRLRKIDEIPVVLDKTFIPYRLCPGCLFEDFNYKSLYHYIEYKYNLKIERGTRFIEATVANEEEAKLLSIKKFSPLLYIESTSFLQDGTPIEYYTAVHRGDKIKLVTELKRIKSFKEIGMLPSDSIVSGLLIKSKLD